MKLSQVQVIFLTVTTVLWLVVISLFVFSSRGPDSESHGSQSSSDYDTFFVNDELLEETDDKSQKKQYQTSYSVEELHHWQPARPFIRRSSRSDVGANGTGVGKFSAQAVRDMDRYSSYGFNIMASDMIAIDRSIPDLRHERCRTAEFPERLPDASVIIAYYNEAASALFRTITSVINHSPHPLLREIVLVDDGSDDRELIRLLDHFLLKQTGSRSRAEIKRIRLENRNGLMRARLAGVEMSAASVLIFLDSHCECMIGWLEPLLSRVASDRTRVVAPAIDSISWVDWSYHMTASSKVGGFNWNLDYRWITPPVPMSPFLPNETPVIAGGLFAIDRQFFHQIGTYDTGMQIWGSENIEISLRVWTCGGSMEIHPCSHVGHVFREKNPYLDAKIADPIVRFNKFRLAAVWMDKYIGYYETMRSGKRFANETSDVSERIDLRKELQCKPFLWFLEKVFPYSHYPKLKETVIIGAIRSRNGKYCIDTSKYVVRVTECPAVVQFKQKFALQEKELRANLLCLRVNTRSQKLTLDTCGQQPSFWWRIWPGKKTVQSFRGKCISMRSVNGTNSVEREAFVDSCSNPIQTMIFQTIAEYRA